MHDESQYPDADNFDGHRFVKPQQDPSLSLSDSSMRGTTLTDASKDFPIWGLGSKSWLVDTSPYPEYANSPLPVQTVQGYDISQPKSERH